MPDPETASCRGDGSVIFVRGHLRATNPVT